jgi:hypothetical protein
MIGDDTRHEKKVGMGQKTLASTNNYSRETEIETLEQELAEARRRAAQHEPEEVVYYGHTDPVG